MRSVTGLPFWSMARPLRAQDWRWYVLLAVTALLRLLANDWDGGHFFHPDERRIAMAVCELSFRPLQLNPHFFAYGSLPIYIVRGVSSLLSLLDESWNHYDEIIRLGRWISGIFAVLTVLLLVRLGERLYSRPAGFLAGFLLAACPLHIQNAHFVTVDTLLCFLVLLALYLLITAAGRGTRRHYGLAGAAIGLAVATKFSALPLLGPLVVAIVLGHRIGRGMPASIGLLMCSLAAACIAVAVAQPYAFIDFAAYSHDIAEQSRMVRHAGLVPYTNQYIGTINYIYEIGQLVFWGMTPLLGAVAVWATVRRVALTVRNHATDDLILSAWVVPFFLITGWFEVKFVRYLLPIYPFMILWAADWLWNAVRLRAWGRTLLWAVSASTLLAAFAFCTIYTRDHTAVSASNWAYRHIPAHSTLLTAHWEEGFPLSVADNSSSQYRFIEIPYYETDTTAKVNLLSENLAVADYIVFPTKRIYGAITQAASKFPLTNNYFHLLFAGDLGYTLSFAQASRPRLFGIAFPDELGDESLSVYDHPKVLIFRNTAHLDAGVIAERILFGIPSKKLSRNDILLADVDDAGERPTDPAGAPDSSDLLFLLQFASLLEALGFGAYFLLRRWLPEPGGYGLAKVLGLLGFAYPLWLMVSTGVFTFSRSTTLLVSSAWLLASLYGIRAWRPSERREMAVTEAVFWSAFGLFLLVRAFNPEIYWGEKPMDFAILNALYRTETLPPPEPWFGGSTLHYSYFGQFMIAAIGKTCGIPPGVMFNLGIALTAALTAVAAFAAGCTLGNTLRSGILSAVFVALIGNLSALRELGQRRALDFDYFWATSRVVPDTINEYPFWSLLFADLHAHVLVMPLTLTFLALIVWRAKLREGTARSARIPLFVLLGLTLGAIPVTNTWSLFSFGTLLPFLLGCMEFTRTGWARRSALSAMVLVLLGATLVLAALSHGSGLAGILSLPSDMPAAFYPIAAIGCFGLAAQRLMSSTTHATLGLFALAAILFLPYWLVWQPPPSNWSLVRDNFVNVSEYALIFGLFLFVAVSYLVVVGAKSSKWASGSGLRARPFGFFAAGLAVAMAALLVTALPVVERIVAIPGASSIRFGAASLAIAALYLAVRSRVAVEQRLILALFSFGLLLTAAVDVVTIWDRMNTVFKFYLDAWLVFSVASAAAISELLQAAPATCKLKRVWTVGLSVLIGTGFVTAATAPVGLLSTRRVPSPRPTLNGTAYLALRDPHEKAAYDWLNQHIGGTPVIAEAYGPSYGDYARVSMNTGLPTVLGWDYHVYQRGHRWPAIDRRKADLKTLYTSGIKSDVASILKRYHVSLVYVGELERRAYAGANWVRFANWNDLLHPIYQNAGVNIYAVKGQFSGAMPSTTIEAVPELAADASADQTTLPDGQLRQARGVSADQEGNNYVADFGNDRIQKFDKDFVFISGWGWTGTLTGQFKQPGDVFVAKEPSVVFVADTWNHRIQRFSPNGGYLGEWGNGFFGPRGITVSRDGTVYVSDTGNHRVRRFTVSGEELSSWGRSGAAPGEFRDPIGVATDAEGRVYVCDNGNARLQIFDRDGRFLRLFPVDGWTTAAFSEPHAIVSQERLIWVTVPLDGAIRAYDMDGHVVHQIDGANRTGGAIFKRPIGITFGASGRTLVISDVEHGLVRLPIPDDGAPDETLPMAP